VAFRERLDSWWRALGWKKLAWLLLLAPWELLRLLLEDRFVGGLNRYIDEHSNTILAGLSSVALFLLTHPVRSVVIFAVLIVTALIFAAYLETRPEAVGISQKNWDAIDWIQTNVKVYSGEELKRISENAPHIDLIFDLPQLFDAIPIIRDTQISVVNTKDSIAYDVKIEDKNSPNYRATFEAITRVEKGHPKWATMDLRQKPGDTYHRDFEILLKLEDEAKPSAELTDPTVRVALTVRFYDDQRNLFQTRHEVVYDTFLNEAHTRLVQGATLIR